MKQQWADHTPPWVTEHHEISNAFRRFLVFAGDVLCPQDEPPEDDPMIDLNDILNDAEQHADTATKEDNQLANEAWKKWVEDASRDGASAAHWWVKGPDGSEAPVTKLGLPTHDALVEEQVDKCTKLWRSTVSNFTSGDAAHDSLIPPDQRANLRV